MKASDEQVGGNHYKDFKIQPYEFFIKNDLPFHKADIIKRILRYDLPGGKGLQDLEKIKHEIDLIIEFQDVEARDFDKAWEEATREEEPMNVDPVMFILKMVRDGTIPADYINREALDKALMVDKDPAEDPITNGICPSCGSGCYNSIYILECNDYVRCSACNLIYKARGEA